jgi:hypothetical protein
MKHIIISLLIAITIPFASIAKEGMWLPMLLEKMNASDMQAMGMRISAQDIYDVNQASIKDAIVHFAGGCTGELVSAKGLLFTNHHCGYRQIQQHSSVDHDYLKNGFWAQNMAEELPNEGLTAKILLRMEDVTKRVLKDVSDKMEPEERAIKIAENIAALKKEQETDEFHEVIIKPFFYGNQYILMYNKVFKDVRLVGAPPSNIGKFGGDTDNWMWPRHTGDFSIFRIYANDENEPATYSEDNKPYVPVQHLKISLKGVQKGDFTFVFGYPGRTQEYLPSYALEMTTQHVNPFRIDMRRTRLDNMAKYMDQSAKVRIQYSAKYAGVANGWKKWIGENRGIKKIDAIAKKQQFEAEFNKWAANNPEYKGLLKKFEATYKELLPYEMAYQHFVESGYRIELVQMSLAYRELVKLSSEENPDEKKINEMIEKLKKGAKKFYKDYDHDVDVANFKAMLKVYMAFPYADKVALPTAFEDIKDLNKYTSKVYKKSIFSSEEKLTEFLNEYSVKKVKKFTKDPIFSLAMNMYNNYKDSIQPKLSDLNAQLEELQRTYMKAQMEMRKDFQFYPDANSTLRITYGKVDGFEPRDGVEYKHYTTLDGIIEKENPDIFDYVVEDRLKELYTTKDYGVYGDKDGSMHVCFIASNHTSGGNSGSPVLNADGHLIGLNFDRNWEGTMSDLMYDPDQCRNITLDVRYCLFIIDKFAGAHWLIEEMDLVK